MSEHQRTVWAMSSTVSSLYNLTIQDLTERSYVTSEQHKELSAALLKRDEIDLRKVAEKLDSVTLFSTDESVNILSWLTGRAIISPDTLKERRHYGMTGSKQTAILVYVRV